MLWRGLPAILFLSVICQLVGCGAKTASVQGKVTVDDIPLKKGVIVFADDKGASVTGNIVDGHYQVRVPPGTQRVQISEQLSGEKKKEHNGKDAPWVDVTKEGLPPRYNSQTELNFEVTAGSQTKDWPLNRKARK